MITCNREVDTKTSQTQMISTWCNSIFLLSITQNSKMHVVTVFILLLANYIADNEMGNHPFVLNPIF